MNNSKKIVIVSFLSLFTMGLFSFKNAQLNETSFKNVNATLYASASTEGASIEAAATGAIIKTAVKVWQKSSRDVVYVTLAFIDFTDSKESLYTSKDVTVKSETLLAKL